MHTQLIVYFDASCALCNSEMQNIKIHDEQNQLTLLDCSAVDFDDTTLRAEGINRSAMMEILHVRDAQGLWVTGVSAFELLYRTVGMSMLASLWGSRYTRPVAEILYPWVARHRQLFTWTGAPLLFRLWGRCAARRANRRRCHNGQCSI